MKHLSLSVDPDRLRENESLETAFVKLHGEKALQKVYSESEGDLYTEEEIEQMSDSEYEANREEIKKAIADNRVG